MVEAEDRLHRSALSFVQRPEDIEDLRQALAALGATIPIIPEDREAPSGSPPSAILATANGIMVAEGISGWSFHQSRVPLIPENHYSRCPGRGPTGDHCHANARIHGGQPHPNPRRSLGCSQRRALGWHGRGHALDGNGKQCLPNLNGRNHGPHRPARRGGPASRVASAENAQLSGGADALSRRLPARLAEWSTSSNLLPQRQRCHPAPTVPPSTRPPPSPSPLPRRSAAFGAALGWLRALPTEPAMARDIEGTNARETGQA